MFLLLKFLLFLLLVVNSLQLYITACHHDEVSALLQFKQSIVIQKSYTSGYEGAYPKMASWKYTGNQTSNCCSWDGIECDEKTGHVVGLDLSSSYIYGSINSDNGLFRLVHLQSLNLADNNFNNSEIPTSIRNFSRLRYLNLSHSEFSLEQVPYAVLQLSTLSSLDISGSDMVLNKGFLRSLAQNLTGLEILDLSSTQIASTPDTFANLSFLTSLSLDACEIFGQFPVGIFNLQNLKVLSILDTMINKDLMGYVLEFNGNISSLISLKISSTFSINLPILIEKFDSLEELGVADSNISEGPVPFSLRNLTHLIYLDLAFNQFTGEIPSFLGNLVQLTYLSLSGNNFHGSIPQSLFKLLNLQGLFLDQNNLSGTIEFHMFLKLQKLTSLSLSHNKLEVLLNESRSMNNVTVLPKFKILELGWCNIRAFPNFLRSQETLETLDLSGNKLQGQVPKWMLNTSIQTLYLMNMSHNFLSGFDQAPAVLPWVKLGIFDLSFNMLHGSLLMHSSSILYSYTVSNNRLTGEVSPMICNLTHLYYLDLSNNKLSGILPQCLRNYSELEYLNLGNNSFHGTLPQIYTNTCNLKMIDVSHNHFHGQLPRSLVYCAELRIVLFSHNKFTDTFPVWLGDLRELKILTMGHNGFYGVIVNPSKKNLHFPALGILDLSCNNFSGEFPFEYIFSGNGTRSFTHEWGYYFRDGLLGQYLSFTIPSKGVERFFQKIQKDLVIIDISMNNFEGQIPEFIGKLKELWSLNISGNILTGEIPSSLGNLTRLESLDLSQNKLSGEIPQLLAQLDFLTEFNVSHNNLTGPIPHGTHFSTFDNTSYEGNPGLCGDPLPKKCGNREGTQLPPSTAEENDSGSKIVWNWKFVWAGFGSGFLLGVVLSDFAITWGSERFIEIVAVLSRIAKRMRTPRN